MPFLIAVVTTSIRSSVIPTFRTACRKRELPINSHVPDHRRMIWNVMARPVAAHHTRMARVTVQHMSSPQLMPNLKQVT
jgi:hypothetical protein